MKFLLIIQGEGRGHLTQAISLTEILERNNHSVEAAIVGCKDTAKLPTLFTNQFQKTIIAVEAPSLVYNQKTNALSIYQTIFQGFIHIKTYFKSLRKIKQTIEEIKPDVIINFYEVLAGFYTFIYRPSIPMICIAHQYLLLNPSFPHPTNHSFNKFIVNTNTRLTALGATKKLALSFTPFPDDIRKNIYTIPPLLRTEVSKLQPQKQTYLLVYLTQPSFALQLIEWHKQNSNIIIYCFCEQMPTVSHSANLMFHQINGQSFLQMLNNCQALITTAGFETICEAMYLGKPIMMLPLAKHYEQFCNAIDAQRAQAGIMQEKLDITALLEFMPTYKDVSASFQSWQKNIEQALLEHITSLNLS